MFISLNTMNSKKNYRQVRKKNKKNQIDFRSEKKKTKKKVLKKKLTKDPRFSVSNAIKKIIKSSFC